MSPVPASELSTVAGNVESLLLRRPIADIRPSPSRTIYRGPQRTVLRYTVGPRTQRPRGNPVLLVPPLAAPAICFDLRRGCSLVEYLVANGHPTYLVDYGEISFADRSLGIEHWIDAVIPDAMRAVTADAGKRPVHLVGWSLGGIMALLVAADDPRRRIASVTMVGSPFDVTQVPLVAPFRPLLNIGGGFGLTFAYRALGGAPAYLVQRAYELAAFEKYVTKPLVMARNIGDRDFLAQIEAVDHFMGSMLAYPGRTFGQLFHRMIRGNELARGEFDVGGRTVRVADARAPVLSIAGRDDGIAPKPSVHHIAALIPDVELSTAPGGHLGVLTGRAARRTTWPTIHDFLRRHDPAVRRRRAPAR
jgi:polyhydroxyalkanoate synthase